MAKRKFLRRIWNRYSRLGRNRKKKQVWRKPKGRDNKMREKRKGYPVVVSIGYGTPKAERGKIGGRNVVTVMNVNEMLKAHEEKKAIIIGKIGNKARLALAAEAKEKGIELENLNIPRFLKRNSMKGVKKNESK